MIRPFRLLLVSILLSIGFSSALARPLDQATPAAMTANLPPGFTDDLVVNASAPTALAWLPDGRMLITQQNGKLRMLSNGTLSDVLDLGNRVCRNSERGLLGVAVHPSFASNGYIYLYYTFNKFNDPNPATCATKTGADAVDVPVNRVSRFVLNGSTIDKASETVLIDNMPSPGGNHNGGDLHFGKDGYLYISVGDGGRDYATGSDYSGAGGNNDAARDKHILLGKILRIDDEGGVPDSNPFVDTGGPCANDATTTPGQHCRETWAWGLRNPFRFALNPNVSSTQLRINDVGQNQWEEIDDGMAGADYGWNCREGMHPNNTGGSCNPTPQNMIDPIYEYKHGPNPDPSPFQGCNSITGGAFVPDGIWPAAYDGTYLFGDYVCNKIFVLNANDSSASLFADDLAGGGPVALLFGPYGNTQALYYTTYANGGQVRRISVNQAPIAAFTATPTSGPLPLTVQFDGSASSDPEGDALTYLWDFGDGNTTATTTAPTTTHTYTTAGNFTASLVVRDANGVESAPATRSISAGNNAPEVHIAAPIPAKLFAVGEPISFKVKVFDVEDDVIPTSAITLAVVLHHASHTHPFLTVPMSDSITFTAPAPEDLLAASTSCLELIASATDSGGVTTVVTQALQPHKVALTFATDPAGLQITVNGETFSGPTTLTTWENDALTINAPNQADDAQFWLFDHWSDNGAQQHSISVPDSATTYTATFTSHQIRARLYLPVVLR